MAKDDGSPEKHAVDCLWITLKTVLGLDEDLLKWFVKNYSRLNERIFDLIDEDLRATDRVNSRFLFIKCFFLYITTQPWEPAQKNDLDHAC